MIAATMIVDAVLIVLAIETVVLATAGRRIVKTPFRDLAPNLAAGFFLLVALRVAVGGLGTGAMAGCLALAGIAHGVDLARRRSL